MVDLVFLVFFDGELGIISLRSLVTTQGATYHDSGEADCSSGEPAQALECKHRVNIV